MPSVHLRHAVSGKCGAAVVRLRGAWARKTDAQNVHQTKGCLLLNVGCRMKPAGTRDVHEVSSQFLHGWKTQSSSSFFGLGPCFSFPSPGDNVVACIGGPSVPGSDGHTPLTNQGCRRLPYCPGGMSWAKLARWWVITVDWPSLATGTNKGSLL